MTKYADLLSLIPRHHRERPRKMSVEEEVSRIIWRYKQLNFTKRAHLNSWVSDELVPLSARARVNCLNQREILDLRNKQRCFDGTDCVDHFIVALYNIRQYDALVEILIGQSGNKIGALISEVVKTCAAAWNYESDESTWSGADLRDLHSIRSRVFEKCYILLDVALLVTTLGARFSKRDQCYC